MLPADLIFAPELIEAQPGIVICMAIMSHAQHMYLQPCLLYALASSSCTMTGSLVFMECPAPSAFVSHCFFMCCALGAACAEDLPCNVQVTSSVMQGILIILEML